MTTAPQTDRYPSRFRAGEARATRMGRPLRLLGRVDALDEAFMDRIGRSFLERDEAGALLADAIRTRAVSMVQVQEALAHGVPEAAHPALAGFFAAVDPVPDWVDFDLVEEGAAVSRRLGQNVADVLLQLSLIGGYRFGGPTDLLAATGGLTGEMTLRRLAETQHWTATIGLPGQLRPGAEGYRLTLHVRLMHALVNAAFEPRWDVRRWGLPISQGDQFATLGLFDATMLLGCRSLGARITRQESDAVMHLWKWVGWLLGVHPDFLGEHERERYRQLYHVLCAQAGLTEAGPQLAQAVVEAQRVRRYPGWPAHLQGLRGWYERERLLSMLTVFLGPRSMRELGLGLRPPWAFAYLWPLNLVRYQLLGRTAWGRRLLEAQGLRVRQRVLKSYFVGAEPEVGELSS